MYLGYENCDNLWYNNLMKDKAKPAPGDLVLRLGETGIVIRMGIRQVFDVELGEYSVNEAQVLGTAGTAWWPIEECQVITRKKDGEK